LFFHTRLLPQLLPLCRPAVFLHRVIQNKNSSRYLVFYPSLTLTTINTERSDPASKANKPRAALHPRQLEVSRMNDCLYGIHIGRHYDNPILVIQKQPIFGIQKATGTSPVASFVHVIVFYVHGQYCEQYCQLP
jgi:hypothetical protein